MTSPRLESDIGGGDNRAGAGFPPAMFNDMPVVFVLTGTHGIIRRKGNEIKKT